VEKCFSKCDPRAPMDTTWRVREFGTMIAEFEDGPRATEYVQWMNEKENAKHAE
jgi:hypothetical protein